jgi:hypothetical protein
MSILNLCAQEFVTETVQAKLRPTDLAPREFKLRYKCDAKAVLQQLVTSLAVNTLLPSFLSVC